MGRQETEPIREYRVIFKVGFLYCASRHKWNTAFLTSEGSPLSTFLPSQNHNEEGSSGPGSMWLVPLNLFLFMCCALSQKGLHNQVLACPFIKRLELRFQFSEPDLKENTTRPGSLMGISCHTYICHATTSSPRQKASGRSSHPVENTSSCREQTGLLLPRLPCLAGETSEACDADAGTRVSPGGLGQGRLLG